MRRIIVDIVVDVKVVFNVYFVVVIVEGVVVYNYTKILVLMQLRVNCCCYEVFFIGG